MQRPKKPNQARVVRDGPIDWKRQMRFDIEYAKRTLLERGQVAAMFVVHTRAGAQVYLTPLYSEATKRATYQLLHLTCIALNAEGLTFMSEAWLRKLPVMPGETQMEARQRASEGPMPRDAEDRIEVVMVQTAYRDAETGERKILADMREITRGTDGKPTGLKEAFEAADAIEGRVVNIFPEEPPSAAERAAAISALELLGGQFDMSTIMPGGNA